MSQLITRDLKRRSTLSGPRCSSPLRDSESGLRRWESATSRGEYVDVLAQTRSRFELYIDAGLQVLANLDAADLEFRNRLFENNADPEEENSLKNHYQNWLRLACDVREQIRNFDASDLCESTKLNVSNEPALSEAITRVEMIFADDAEFFDSDKLVELRDAAVTEFRSGTSASDSK